ncbi:FecR domain-containing protein [Carboxylicivirga sp. N1Y90]|uniref:FecR domain-containing protein n=1 Tax=Carboxylicivirga fragile TaxID=3417571 RepID=UPI003D340211|nr:FecR domain-containing protein [Marinilabiliaceae bacterium N1Y90]
MEKYPKLLIAILLTLTSCNQIHIKSKNTAQIISLPDSSLIILNIDSKISFNKDFHERKVILQGEGFFIVNPKSKQFIVETNHGDICVLGTSFNVESNKDQLNVEVDEGEVEVIIKDEKKKLLRGERILYNDAKQLFIKRKAEFKHHIWTEEFKNDMSYLEKEVEKGGKKLHKRLKKWRNEIKNKL